MATSAGPIATPRQSAKARLRLRNAAAAIQFYEKAFGAKELFRFEIGGSIPAAEIAIGNTIIMVSDEAPEWGCPGPDAFGGSPVSIYLSVDDADAAVERALAAGAKLIAPVKDHFYGERGGTVADPYGYQWGISTLKEELTVEEMHRRFAAEQSQQPARTAPSYIPGGFHAVTPYLVAQDAPAMIDFVKQVFGAEELGRDVGSAGGIHCTVRVGDSILMLGGGGPGLSFQGETWRAVLHTYVPDCDAVYDRAIKAGAVSIAEPVDQDYGERGGSVKDPFGNMWYMATANGKSYLPEGLHNVNPYMHPLRAEPVISFLKRAFGAEEIARYASPDGIIHHAQVKLGDSAIEMGEAKGPYQPVPMMFYVYVPDVDAMHSRAVRAGAVSTREPADQPYGDRVGAAKDAFGNLWYLARRIK